MVNVRRGEIWWSDLGEPMGSEPGYLRPVLIVQDNALNQSHLATVIVLSITSSVEQIFIPGNIPLPRKLSRLKLDSTINISQLTTIDKSSLDNRVSQLPETFMAQVEGGLKLVLGMD